MYVQGHRPSLGVWEILPSGETEVNFLGKHKVRSGKGQRVEYRGGWTGVCWLNFGALGGSF